MPYKLCPNCNQSSYSASERGVWNCPHCGQNMTFVASAGAGFSLQNLENTIKGSIQNGTLISSGGMLKMIKY